MFPKVLFLLLPLMISVQACESDAPVGSELQSSQAPLSASVPTNAPMAAPTLVASLTLASGNTIEFYDFGGNAMISETGVAYSPQSLNNKNVQNTRLVDIWAALAPRTPVPAALASFQLQLDKTPSASTSTPRPQPLPTSASGGQQTSTTGPTPYAPVGCNNGCCDFQWLSTFEQCQTPYVDYQWFLYNYLWSNDHSTNIWDFFGMACSAIGTSTYSVNMAGYGGTWSVPEATYRTWHRANTWCIFSCENLTATVNSSTNQHLHTHCGWVNYF
jgi:hypothetical protein